MDLPAISPRDRETIRRLKEKGIHSGIHPDVH